MNKSTNTPNITTINPADNNASQWLYGVDAPSECSQQQAENQLVHALLIHAAESASEDRRARVQKVMHTIEKNNANSRFHYFGAVGIAASMLIGVVFIMTLTLRSPTALAEVDKLINAMTNMSDRHYRVTVENVGRNAQPLDKRDRKSFRGGELYLRGQNQYLLIQTKAPERIKTIGSDGITSWLINPKGNLTINPTPQGIRLPLSVQSASISLMNVQQSVEQLKTGYDLSVSYQHNVTHPSGESVAKITATKQDSGASGVKEAHIYYTQNSLQIVRIVFDRVHIQGNTTPKRITMELISTSPLPADWFTHSYHSQNNPVRE